MLILQFLELISYKTIPTGSRHTCDPPVMDTDEDYAVLGNDDTTNKLLLEGYRESQSKVEYDIKEFRCFRKEDINVLVTWNSSFFTKFANATKLAKHLNLIAKSDRIALFQAILYNKYP